MKTTYNESFRQKITFFEDLLKVLIMRKIIYRYFHTIDGKTTKKRKSEANYSPITRTCTLKIKKILLMN